MFTGLIEEIGTVKAANMQSGNLVLEISATAICDSLQLGDSVSINGACQTVVAFDQNSFTVNTITESLGKTNLGQLRNGDRVNLERALRPDSRLGGHLVSGHIDCLGEIKSIRQIEGSWEVVIDYPKDFSELVVAKGSIAISGISLTVTRAEEGRLAVAIIPHTWEQTTFPLLRKGDSVNLEFDLIGKYVQKMINPYQNKTATLTADRLRRAGF